MAGLSDQLARIAAYRAALQQYGLANAGHASLPSRLQEATGFGTNPGNLRMMRYIPQDLPEGAPLVVALHGCTQTAASYDYGSGWSTLADRLGFALLMPEQKQANNQNLCFTWFLTGDTRRSSGEASSIRQMVEHMMLTYNLDRDRVFAVGLSAGGAMTSAMLASYPDVFRAGAVIAGLPFGAASSMSEALEAMRQGRVRTARQLGDLVRAAARHPGPWPRVSIWHGSADGTVNSINAELSSQQWREIHQLGAEPTIAVERPDMTRRIWRDARGVDLVEVVTVPGMAHGVPISGTAFLGNVSPYHFDVGISSTEEIARFLGLEAAPAKLGKRAVTVATARKTPSKSLVGEVAARMPSPVVREAGVWRRLMRRLGLER